MRRARVFALVLLWAAGAHAQTSPKPEPNRLVLEVTGCSDELAKSLPEVVNLEIDVLLRESGATRAPPERIQVHCDADRAAISARLAGIDGTTSLDLTALAPEHRARAIALAAAELVHALSHRASVANAPPKPEAARPPSPPLRAASEPPPPPSTHPPVVFLGGLVEWLGEPAAVLFGARAALHTPLGKLVVPALSLDGALGERSAQSADISVKTLSLAAHLFLGTNTGPVRWDAGPGARLGLASLSGRPHENSSLEGHTLLAAWAGPELRARVAYGAARSHSTLFALELGAGLVALPVRGLKDGSESIYAIRGHWLSICAGVGLAF